VERLPVIPGSVPNIRGIRGCRFAGRCMRAEPACTASEPVLEERAPGHFVACIHPGQLSGK
jgi:peptide/nickel transport system ATP-binding protein